MPTVMDCLFETNSTAAGFGGAIFVDATSSPIITGCTFLQNTSASGGAIYNGGGSPMIADCRFATNNATRGGAYFGHGGAPTIIDSVFRGNFSATLGGGVYLQGGGAPALFNCTIGGNFAEQGAGMFVHSTGALIAGCLVSGNRADTLGPPEYGASGRSRC